MDSKADVTQQAVCVGLQWGEAPELRPRIPGDPVLQAILGKNTCLLKLLLKAVHAPSASQVRCKVCESGSGYRKMIAWAMRLQDYEAIKILQTHQIEADTDTGSDIANIEVWYNQELLPAWNLVYRGHSTSVIDLPESFCRALTHGEKYRESLRKTLQFLWTQNPLPDVQLYKQLQQSVILKNSEAIDYIMEEARRLEYPREWWLTGGGGESPFLLSIKLGFRDIFDRLWSVDDKILHHNYVEDCSTRDCSKHSSNKGWLRPPAQHYINLAQIALSLAAVAPHYDQYFL